METSGKADFVTRALQAVKLLTKIRQEKPELWKQLKEFIQGCRRGN